jgi:phospho-N-acetylmuramoyl-pentapeptide-transferase
VILKTGARTEFKNSEGRTLSNEVVTQRGNIMHLLRPIIYLCVFAAGFLLSVLFTGLEIPFLKKRQLRQYIREEGPKSHQKKAGTPTMGGVAIYASIIVTSLVFGALELDSLKSMLAVVAFGFFFGLIGFLDDFIKVAEKHNLGLRAWQKLALQILFSILLCVYIMKFTNQGTNVWIPFINRDVAFGIWYIPFVIFVMVAMTNSVNLTDGLDGLCGGVTAIVSLFFVIVGHHFLSPTTEIYCLAMAGACGGFLVFNHHPAKIFMGDTGSLALGAGLTGAVLLTKAELLIPFAGFVFVMESASVIIQVVSFKTRGKRVFRMSPIHHHFELGGMKETSVVHMFWAIALICCVIAYGIMRIG